MRAGPSSVTNFGAWSAGTGSLSALNLLFQPAMPFDRERPNRRRRHHPRSKRKVTMRFPSFLLASLAPLVLAGCVAATGQARNVLVERDGGVIAMPVTDKNYIERANREKSVALMVAKCGRNYEITREEEVEVGVVEETYLNPESSSKSNKTVVKSRKCEYRIWYRCR